MARTTLRSMIDGTFPLAGIRGASPLAKHVSNSIQDPVGATKEGFEDLQRKNLEYEQAKDSMRRQLAPVESVIQHVKDTHGLDENQNGIPDDEELGYQDPNQIGKPGMQMPGMPMKPGQMPQMNPNLPQNMQQAPGAMQQNKPGQNLSQPGTGPKMPGQPVQTKPAVAAKPGASKANGNGKKAATAPSPGGRKIKVHVTAGSTPGIPFSSGHTSVTQAAANAGMRFGGPGSGRHPGAGGGLSPMHQGMHEKLTGLGYRHASNSSVGNRDVSVYNKGDKQKFVFKNGQVGTSESTAHYYNPKSGPVYEGDLKHSAQGGRTGSYSGAK